MKKYILFSTLFYVAFGFAQSTNQNFIKSTAYKVATTNGTTKVAGGAVTDTDKQVAVTYYDGLGRPIQQNAYQASNSGQNIITHIEYDAFGRQTKEFLPFPNAGDLSFIDPSSAASAQLAYYDPNSGNAHARTTVPFSEKLFEASPLNRVLEQGAPGEDWSLSNSDKHTIRLDYQTNTADEVKMYVATSNWDSNSRLYNCALTQTQFYPAGTLYKTITKDENHGTQDYNLNTVVEFKDKEGRVILKRTFNYNNALERDEPLDTYYVYDQFGMLSFVLPPLCDHPTKLNSLGYQYRYDQRNRLVEKKLPGKLWEFICYDKLDRVVATGPVISPENPNEQAVLYTKYDAFNRAILTGYARLGSQTRAQIQSFYDNATVLNESKSASGNTISDVYVAYTNNLVHNSDMKVLTVNYFDDYNFPGALHDFSSVFRSPIYYDNGARKPKGLATGTWVRVISTAARPEREITTFFYDDKARVVKTHKENYLGGQTLTESLLDFSGKVLKKLTLHRREHANSNEIRIDEQFEYSPQDRLLTHLHRVNGGTWEVLANNTYDELGQLISKKVGKQDPTGASFLQKVDYAYNIRGWLTNINNIADTADEVTDLFAFKINYNRTEQNISNVLPLYNGNISETYWRTESDGFTRMYGYQYDDLNRLLKGNYRKMGYSVTGNYDETLSYDKHGNIQTLQRNGFADADFGTSVEIDNLVYAYDGNQLLAVQDMSNSLNGFRDNVNNGTPDYGYDAYGNMTSDANKRIEDIDYNHLNLPTVINFQNNSGRIRYTYDALGVKVRKEVDDINGTTTTDYLDGFQYKNEVLSFFSTAEGYVEFKEPNRFFYVYNYTDHLGNVRMSYTDNGTAVPKILEENHYYPFGLKHENYASERFEFIKEPHGTLYVIQPTERREWQYKYNGKEWQDELGLNFYDYGARNYDAAIGRWMNVDPLAEQAPGWTPYRYGFNNPIRYTDPTGMYEGDFLDENGRYLGNDGIDDGKVYVVKTTQKSFATGQDEATPSAGISKQDAKATKDFIKNNSGNTEAFQNNSIAYDNSVEIVGSSDTRQAMVDIVNQDNGRGGTSDANNREYGGSINRDGTVTQAPAGAVGNPLENSNVSITLTTTFENQSTFHSHPSGSRTEGNRTGSWAQPPSYKGGDVQVSGSAVNYVFARGNGTVYIYNNQGVIATIPQENFVTPKK